jgi:hypothetical protein
LPSVWNTTPCTQRIASTAHHPALRAIQVENRRMLVGWSPVAAARPNRWMSQPATPNWNNSAIALRPT